MNNGDNKIESRINIILIIAGISASLVVAVYLIKIGAGWDSITDDLERWGQTGDFFGGILNPLFGLLSVIALVLTLRQNQKALSQNQEALAQGEEALRQTREEMEKSREEMRRSADASFMQVKHIETQGFEGTFFELMRLRNEIVASFLMHENNALREFRGQPAAPPHTGIKVFQELYDQYLRVVARVSGNHLDWGRLGVLRDAYSQFYLDNMEYLGHYFRVLYSMLKFVDRSNVANKKVYSDMLRSQLSSHELLLIFYNVFSDMGSEKMLPLVHRYNLLKHLPKDKLADSGDLELLNAKINQRRAI